MSYAISSLLRLALDTDVLVAAMRSRGGASWQLVNRALTREFTLLLSVPLVLEYEAVLTREEHRKVRGLSVLEVNEIINSLASVAESAQIRFLWRPLLPDPADDMVLETAGRRSSRPACHVQPRGFRGCGKRTGTPLMPLLARE